MKYATGAIEGFVAADHVTLTKSPATQAQDVNFHSIDQIIFSRRIYLCSRFERDLLKQLIPTLKLIFMIPILASRGYAVPRHGIPYLP